MHKNREFAVSPLQGNGVCTILNPEQRGIPCSLLPDGYGGYAAMNSVGIIRGRAFCSLCFSFGAACGVLWILRCSEALELRLFLLAQSCFVHFPFLSATTALCVWPAIFFLLGLSPAGHFFISIFVAGAGFFAGSACALARESTAASAACLCMLPVFSICIVSLATTIMQSARLFRGKLTVVFGGRQDFGYFLSQMLLNMVILALSAAVLGVYLSRF